MTEHIVLPSLPKLLSSWKTIGALHFYKKFLEESRKPFGNQAVEVKEKKRVYTLLAIRRKIASLGNLSILIVRCFFVPKGRIIIFNHTARKRLDKLGVRPLYLLQSNFDLAEMVVFEDKASKFVYPKGAVQLNTEYIDQAVGLIGFFANKCCGLIYGVSDRDITDFVIKMHLWKIIFAILKPLRIHVLVWYGKESLIAACKQLGLEVWDLQHGIIYEEHPIYNISDAINIVDSSFLLPDKCLVYGEYWRQHLLRSGWDEKKVSVVGYFLDIDPGFTNISAAPYVLYTSQPHSNQAIINHIQAIELEVRHRGWRIIIALHPSERGDAYTKIISSNVQLTQFDSYDLLRNCRVHLSVSSTLLWEAMLFEKSSYVLEYGREAVGLLNDILKYGYARKLGEGKFPEPFDLPLKPGRDFFFHQNIDRLLLNRNN